MTSRIFLFTLLGGLPGVGLAAPATQASVERLFLEMRIEAQMEDMRSQVGAFLTQQNDAMLGQFPELKSDPELQRLVDEMVQNMMDSAFEEMTGAEAQAEMVAVYTRVFTEEEVQGLIGFYTSPVGRAFTDKMPAVTRESIALVQKRMQSFVPRMQRDLEKFQKDVLRLVEERKQRR